jgi:hypothetical protein
MASNNQSQTINISSQNVYGNCDLKCSYNYKYNKSNSIATNEGVFVSLTYDKGTTSPVVYNTQNYYVSKIKIYTPSLHKFNDKLVNAELIIEHYPEIGGDLLYVCIPIIESTNSSDSSNMLTEIIKSISNSAPSLNEKTNLNINNFTLDTFVPQKPFFSYSGTSGLVGQIIVFGVNYAIPLNKNILAILSKIIKPYPITISGGNLFLNNKGPNNVQVNNNGIYISCQPTGSSAEEMPVTYDNKPSVDFNLSSIFSNSNSATSKVLQVIFGCIIFILLFLVLNFAYNYLTSSPQKLPSMKLPSINLPTMKMPSMNLSNMKLPNMNLSNMKLPNMKMPSMKLPKIKLS